jgi:primosomal protein N' (replication factor Y)
VSAGFGDDLFASVAVAVPVRRLFTYRVDERLRADVDRGTRVRVPFGQRTVAGTVVEWPASRPATDVEIKSVEAVLAGARRLPAEILELTRFVADYYLCSWGEAIEAATPRDVAPRRPGRAVRKLPAADPESVPARARARRSLLDSLPDDGSAVPVGRLGASERRAIRGLQKAGWVEVVDALPVAPDPNAGEAAATPEPEPGPQPTAAQASVLSRLYPALAADAYAPFLLFGATGSGKTEVYFRAAREVLDHGRGVLYLVPEIGLTPILIERVRRRFPGSAALMHSGLSPRERQIAWEEVRSGRRRLVVGTRSAVFAPVRELGLIVVDEEHDGSYKQEEIPRYNARDMAVVRAREAGAVVLLGSATPSMESFLHARSGRYDLLRLGGRVRGRPLPTVRLVDMRLEYERAGEITPLSRELAEQLRACVSRGEQALVLRNRRGWAAALVCPTCGERVICSQCSIAMTWHLRDRRLRCHYCASEERYPECCPKCGGEALDAVGEGTEKIEERIREAVPEARVERMDRDTIRRRGAHEELLRRFEGGEIDVLVGTQMIAKGHDFPRITLVGVLSADQTLGMPDFRAGERAFQLLTQVAGRAGRGERPGTVVIQAYDPDHPLLGQAATQDFESFFDREIRYRRALRYPPLTALVKIVVVDKEEHQARHWAARVGEALRRETGEKLLVGGPGPAPLERLKGRWRQQILVRTAGRRRLIAAVERSLDSLEGRVPRRAIHVDVDPYSML